MKEKRPRDHEMWVMQRLCQLLATLPLGGRRRVVTYVSARIETLPTIAGVEGGIEDDTMPPLPFHRENTDAAA